MLLAFAWAGETWLGVPHWIAVGLYVSAYLFGGFDLFGHLLLGLRKRQFRFDIDLLMLLAALANATVGIAMGGAGTAAALETADVALMGDDLSKLPFAIGLSRSARRIIRQNLVIALGTIVVLAAATTLGFAWIGPAVIVHESSTLVVLFNSLRLLAYKTDLDQSMT